jgi:hypothetical protein
MCGGKNYLLPEVYQYLNENIELARDRGVQVHRLYVAPDDSFYEREWEVIEAHLEWAEKLRPFFKVGVLMGKPDCAELLELELPHKFGLVLTKHKGLWEARIHYGLNDREQGGWKFHQEAIVLKLRKLFEDISQKAERIGIPTTVREAMSQEMERLSGRRERRLWRYGQDRPI